MVWIFLLLLSGCCQETFAPVVDAWQDPHAMKSLYRVQEDDTIYSIALGFDLDYRDLAKANHLSPPYTLSPGQTLTMQVTESSEDASQVTTYAAQDMTTPSKEAYQEISSQPLIEKPYLKQAKQGLPIAPTSQLPIIASDHPKKTMELNQHKVLAHTHSLNWQWPVRGKVIRPFSLEMGGNKGIDIAGNLGEPVRAVAAGKVVYSGSGLRGYGNLIIIKHSDNYLSAYAYNQRLLVKEGEAVKAGAEIAKMGQNDMGCVLLHFEIRRNGKPVNPALYL